MFLFDGIALRIPRHSEEAVTPTGTSRPLLAAIATGRAVPAPPRGRGGASTTHCRLRAPNGRGVRLLFAPPPIRRGSR